MRGGRHRGLVGGLLRGARKASQWWGEAGGGDVPDASVPRTCLLTRASVTSPEEPPTGAERLRGAGLEVAGTCGSRTACS